MKKLFEPIILRGDYCTIVPLSIEHLHGLVESVKDGELWKLWYTYAPEPEKMMECVIIFRLKLMGRLMFFLITKAPPVGAFYFNSLFFEIVTRYVRYE